MKQFIVLLAVLPLTMVFILQFSLDQINSSRIAMLSDIVYTAKEEAKQEGCFTQEIKDGMCGKLSEAFGIEPGEIEFDTSEGIQYRLNGSASAAERGIIHYRITVPIGKIMAGGRLFGIREDENTYYYTIDSLAASEKLR